MTVFAAASLKTALDAVNAACDGRCRASTATISYAASSALARQIEEGAPADVFMSADLDWMDYLADRNLIKPDTEVKLLGNQHRADRAGGFEGRKRRSTRASTSPACSATAGSPWRTSTAVPAGKYGKAALESLGVWASVEGKVAQAENVRAALALVVAPAKPRSASSTRPTPPPTRACRVVATFPEDTPSADRLPGRRRPPDRDRKPRRRPS